MKFTLRNKIDLLVYVVCLLICMLAFGLALATSNIQAWTGWGTAFICAVHCWPEVKKRVMNE